MAEGGWCCVCVFNATNPGQQSLTACKIAQGFYCVNTQIVLLLIPIMYTYAFRFVWRCFLRVGVCHFCSHTLTSCRFLPFCIVTQTHCYSFNLLRSVKMEKAEGGAFEPHSFIPMHSKHAFYISILWSGPRMHIHLPLTKQIVVHPTRWPQSQSGETGSSLTQIRVN